MENKQRTPLSLAIDINRKSIKELQKIKIKTDFAKGMLAYAHAVEEDLKSLKPKEREMLESAYNAAMKSKYTNGFIDLTLVKTDRLPETFEQYYNDNLTQE